MTPRSHQSEMRTSHILSYSTDFEIGCQSHAVKTEACYAHCWCVHRDLIASMHTHSTQKTLQFL
jgi:hypothetical protein